MRLRLALIIIFALGLRLAALQFYGEAHVPWNYEYEEIAENLLQYGDYTYSFYGMTSARPSSFIPPVYPLMLTASKAISTESDFPIKLFQILISSISILPLFALARILGASERISLFACILMAIYPPSIAYAVSLGTATVETTLLLLGTWLVIRSSKHNSLIGLALSGFVFSLASLTRSPWITLVPISILWILLSTKRSISSRLLQAMILLAASAITLSPWVAYNFRTHGKFLLTSTNGGLNFWIGNNANATGEYVFPTQLNRDMISNVADWSEIDRDSYLYERGFEFIRSSPAAASKLALRKLGYFIFFRPNIGSTYEGAGLPLQLARISFIIAWVALLPFTLIGLITIRINWHNHLLPLAFFVSQGILVTIYFAGTRFRTPLDGFAIIWAVMGMSWLNIKWQRRKLSPSKI